MGDGLTGLGRRSALALVGAGVSGVSMVAVLVIAGRSLSTERAGEFFVAIALFAIVQGVCSLGIETGLQYFVPTMHERGARRLIASMAGGSAAFGLTVAVIVGLLAGPFGELLGDGETGSSTTAVIRSLAFFLPFAGVYEVAMGALRACDDVVRSTVLDRILRPIAQVAAMLVVAIVDARPLTLMLGWVIPTVVAVLIALGLLTRTRLRGTTAHIDEVDRGEFWRYTGPRALARIAQTLTQRVDVLILAAVAPLGDAGIYGTVSRCMIAGVFIATALRQTIQPQLRRLVLAGDHDAVKTMYGASTTWLVLVTWPVYLAMITHAPVVMSAFGPEYVRGDRALMLLCAAMLVASGCGLVDVVLLMLGRSWLSSINVVVALVVNLVLNLVLAPPLGMIGAAIAWVAAILTTNLLPLFQTSRVGLHPAASRCTPRPRWRR